MDILVCPVCKGDLEFSMEKEDEEDIVSGFLYCSECEGRRRILTYSCRTERNR